MTHGLDRQEKEYSGRVELAAAAGKHLKLKDNIGGTSPR